jgi:hypothetical protein
MDVGSGFDMGGQHIGAGCRIGVDIGIDGRNHQMHIHHRFHMGPERLDRRRTKGEVRHEMPVHHIDMHPIGALILDGADLAAEIGEIRRQDRGSDLDGAIK